MNSISQRFAHAAFKARIVKGLSQEKVAELAGISIGWYQRIEKGEVNASLVICIRIAAILGLDLNLLKQEALNYLCTADRGLAGKLSQPTGI